MVAKGLFFVIVVFLAQAITSTLVVDYGKSAKELTAEGKYEKISCYFAEKNFPEGKDIGEESIQVRLFNFEREITADEVIKEMGKENFRPATLKELLAYGAANLDCEKDGDTIALWKFQLFGLDMVPVIFPDTWQGDHKTYRSIGQVSWDTKWPIRHESGDKIQSARFLGVAIGK